MSAEGVDGEGDFFCLRNHFWPYAKANQICLRPQSLEFRLPFSLFDNLKKKDF